MMACPGFAIPANTAVNRPHFTEPGLLLNPRGFFLRDLHCGQRGLRVFFSTGPVSVSMVARKQSA